jgi:hypothetical protein
MRHVRLDHVSYAAGPEGLASCVQRLGSLIGAPLSDGGLHPRFGTRNFVLPLAGGTYLEVVGVLDHPAADKAPFGRAVKARSEDGGGWLGWVLAVDDIAPVEGRLGRPAAAGNRHRPDGFELRWHQIGVLDVMADHQLPFFVHWEVDAAEHPSAGARGDLRIAALEIAGDADAVSSWLGEPVASSLDGVAINWVEDDEPGLVAVHLATPRGIVRVA